MNHLRTWVAVGVVALAAQEAAAQSAASVHRRTASRDELKMAIGVTEQAAERSAGRTKEKLQRDVAAMKRRLETGDFLPGHRVLMSVPGADSALSDTFTVRGDQQLLLPQLPPISLRGVLDSELQGYLRTELGKYIKDPAVTASGLVRVQLNGGIGRPGFHIVPVDLTVTDLIMVAGGPASGVNMRQSIVRRGDEVVTSSSEFATMLQLGLTVGDMALRDGDEIVLPNSPGQSGVWATRVAPIMAASGTLFFILRRR